MSKLIILLFTWCFSSLLFAQFQTVDSSLRAKLTPDFEVFDSVYFEKIRASDTQGRDTLSNGTTVIMADRTTRKSYEETPSDSYWSLFKYYYPNGYIKEKGLWYTTNSNFEIGTWYYFDEKGNLTDSINYDQYFTFTFEQVLQFIEQERVEKFNYLEERKTQSKEYEYYYDVLKKPFIGRGYYPKEQKSRWGIKWTDLTSQRYYRVKLDGNTGEVLSREYERIPPKTMGAYNYRKNKFIKEKGTEHSHE